MTKQINESVSFRVVKAPVAAANNTDSNTSIIDTAGYDGVAFLVPVTDSVATGVAVLMVEQNDLNQDGGMSALEGAVATATCVVSDDLNDKLLVVDVYRPGKRYVQGVLTSTTANIAFGNVIAVLYNGRKLPPVLDASVLDLAGVSGPAQV